MNAPDETKGSWPSDLEIIVPAFNEQDRIRGTLLALVEYLQEMPLRARLRVIDNGSSDRTPDIVDMVSRSQPTVDVTVESCSQRGKGSAVAHGMVTSSARWVGFCDADLATPAEAIAEAVSYLEEGWPIVIGSRHMAGSKLLAEQSSLRRAGGAGFRLLTRGLTPYLSDTQCGFKFFEGNLARSLFEEVELCGFAFDVEVLARAHLLGIPVREFPVSWTDRAGSSFRPVRHGREVAGDIWRLRRTCRALNQSGYTLRSDDLHLSPQSG